MEILMREDSKVVEVEQNIKVEFANCLYKTNRHGARIVKVFVTYSEHSNDFLDVNLHFKGKCSLMSDGKGLNWEFSSAECTTGIAEKVINLFTYQDVVDYITRLSTATLPG